MKEGILLQEAELIQRIRQQDEDAFQELFHAYKNKALRTATLIAGNQADGEDIVQEAFVKCYLHIASLKNDTFFASWFYQILTRTAWEFCRKRKKELPVAEFFEEDEKEGEPSALEQLLQYERANDIYRQILRLDMKHRVVVILYYYNEMSVKEIAQALDCFEGTIKSRLHVARKQLKNFVESERKKEAEVCKNAKFGSIG